MLRIKLYAVAVNGQREGERDAESSRPGWLAQQ